MFYVLSKVLDVLLDPVGLALLLLACSWWVRRQAVRRALQGTACLALLAFSTAAVADSISRWAEGAAPRTYRPDQVYDAVIVLGGIMEQRAPWRDDGQDLAEPAERLVRAFELLRAGRAREVLISGGDGDAPAHGEVTEADQLAAILEGWGVAPAVISVEPRSRNTHENAVESAGIVTRHGWHSVLLVTSAAHMPRALGCFRRAGMTPDALPVDYRGGAAAEARHLVNWLPRSANLGLSALMIRELAGRVVYRVKGYTP
jgi:uncharacterized SAM-binding protein YcdF (DUF218 family)